DRLPGAKLHEQPEQVLEPGLLAAGQAPLGARRGRGGAFEGRRLEAAAGLGTQCRVDGVECALALPHALEQLVRVALADALEARTVARELLLEARVRGLERGAAPVDLGLLGLVVAPDQLEQLGAGCR